MAIKGLINNIKILIKFFIIGFLFKGKRNSMFSSLTNKKSNNGQLQKVEYEENPTSVLSIVTKHLFSLIITSLYFVIFFVIKIESLAKFAQIEDIVLTYFILTSPIVIFFAISASLPFHFSNKYKSILLTVPIKRYDYHLSKSIFSYLFFVLPFSLIFTLPSAIFIIIQSKAETNVIVSLLLYVILFPLFVNCLINIIILPIGLIYSKSYHKWIYQLIFSLFFLVGVIFIVMLLVNKKDDSISNFMGKIMDPQKTIRVLFFSNIFYKTILEKEFIDILYAILIVISGLVLGDFIGYMSSYRIMFNNKSDTKNLKELFDRETKDNSLNTSSYNKGTKYNNKSINDSIILNLIRFDNTISGGKTAKYGQYIMSLIMVGFYIVIYILNNKKIIGLLIDGSIPVDKLYDHITLFAFSAFIFISYISVVANKLPFSADTRAVFNFRAALPIKSKDIIKAKTLKSIFMMLPHILVMFVFSLIFIKTLRYFVIFIVLSNCLTVLVNVHLQILYDLRFMNFELVDENGSVKKNIGYSIFTVLLLLIETLSFVPIIFVSNIKNMNIIYITLSIYLAVGLLVLIILRVIYDKKAEKYYDKVRIS